MSAIGRLLLKRDDVSICSSFLSSRTSLLPSLSVNLPSRRQYTYRRREKERGRGGGRGRRNARRERKRGSRVEWKRDGSIYRLLSSDAPRITFVRFAGVDDVVAHGVGVISTQEGTYLPITVPPSLLPSCAHIRMHLLASSFSPLSHSLFPRRRAFHVSLLFPPPIFAFFPSANFTRTSPSLHESIRRGIRFLPLP